MLHTERNHEAFQPVERNILSHIVSVPHEDISSAGIDSISSGCCGSSHQLACGEEPLDYRFRLLATVTASEKEVSKEGGCRVNPASCRF